MSVKPGKSFDRAGFDACVERIKAHPDFAEARARFCRDVPDAFLHSDLRRTLIVDTSCFAIIIGILGMNRLDPENGAAPSTLVRTLEAGGLASATRIRAYIDELTHVGALEITPHPDDARRRRLVPTPLLIGWVRNWFAAMLGAVELVFDLPMPGETLAHTPGMVERYLATVMLRHAVDNFTIFSDFPEADAFCNRRHGYLLFLALAASESVEIEVGRSHMAGRFGVSPAHIATILGDAEAQGWLTRSPPSSLVRLTPEFAARLETWVARELAVIGIWAEERLGTERT
jgi:hypothetical protein